MDVLDPWPSFAHHSMTSTPCDQSFLQSQAQPDAPCRSQDAEWQKIVDEVEGGNEHSLSEFDMFHSPDAAMLRCQPRQSIEIPAMSQDQPLLSATSSNSSSSLSSVASDQQHPVWSTMSTPLAGTYPPQMVEFGTCLMPPSFTFSQLAPGAMITGHDHSPAPHHAAGTTSHLHQMTPFDGTDGVWDGSDASQFCMDGSGSDEANDVDTGDPCYAQLLWRCLKDAPEHILSLKELYDWVARHSQKARDPKNRGWQNSVRHNLSMNAAFERVPPGQCQGVKKGSLWRLTPQALRDGVISTTRYRKDPKRKPDRRSSPALKRQISGAKGGQATRAATRRQQALREARSLPNLNATQRHRRYQQTHVSGFRTPTPMQSARPSPPQTMLPYHAPASPYFVDFDEQATAPRPSPLMASQFQLMYSDPAKPALQEFDFGHTDFSNGGLFGNQEYIAPETPSLATDASCWSDEGLQMSMSHVASREATNFPADFPSQTMIDCGGATDAFADACQAQLW